MANETPQDNLASLVRGLKTIASPFRSFLNDLQRAYASLDEGSLPDSIPELARADPAWFGICIADTDGQIYESGMSKQPFTIQSIANPFIYGLALMEHGREYVSARVGTEPANNSIDAILLSARTRRLPNPIIAAGALATASMIQGDTATAQLHRMLDMFQRYTGREMLIDAEVFTAMRMAGHRYRGLAHLLRNDNIIGEQVDETLDLFFQQQSLLVTCRDLAVMAATLAGGGVNPVTGAAVLEADHVKSMLNVMYTCGMRDFTGTWSDRVGLPAVSGISGGLLAVVPQQIGIAVFSPLLNPHGLSVRGLKVCEDLAQQFGLHIFDAQTRGAKLREAMSARPAAADRSRISRALPDDAPDTQ